MPIRSPDPTWVRQVAAELRRRDPRIDEAEAHGIATRAWPSTCAMRPAVAAVEILRALLELGGPAGDS